MDPDYGNRGAAKMPTKTSETIANLRKMIENKDYVDAAVERLALVLSDEILDCRNYKEGGQYNERFRKRRK
jgi:hypothetical protein